MTIEVRNIVKQFGAFTALDDVDLKVDTGELVALLGPSGSGKTTLLRIIAGLDWPDSGLVSLDGEDALSRGAGERQVGFVFQHYALFRHMSVFENVAFGLRVQPRAVRKDEAGIRARVRELLDLVQLDWLANRYPSQLSGGQRQRIALARAIVTKPSVLLLDEPLAALDKKLREQMQVEIKQLQRQVGVTTIFVTHDQEEALTLSDRIVVMDEGRIVQIGTPSEVYECPRSRFVSDFIGFTNSVSGRVNSIDGALTRVTIASGHVVTVPSGAGIAAGDAVDLVIRPEKVVVDPSGLVDRSVIPGTLAHMVYTGAVTYYHVDIGDGAILIAMAPNENPDRHDLPALGSPVALGFKPDNMLIFPRRAES